NALADRAEGKDIYDVAMSIDSTTHLDKSVKKALESEGKNLSVKEFFDKCVKKLEGVDAKYVRNVTNPIIPISQRPRDWKILIDTLAQKLKTL
ncbi:MAG: hypothetical protein Q8R15_00690, partial [Candidatus Micrarchaeota archaeon]|nr:hypothetical protein [Candidatus Micrarchaeota archaeon]